MAVYICGQIYENLLNDARKLWIINQKACYEAECMLCTV